MRKKIKKIVYQIMTPPPTQWAKSWGYVDFKMAANDNALNQQKLELVITGIIQNVFQANYTTNKKLKHCWKKINYFPREGGGGGTPPWKIPWK